MCFFRLCFLILVFLDPLPVKGSDLENVPFNQNYGFLWGQENIRILNQSLEVQLTLDENSGSGFQSNNKYGSGCFRMRIKLPQKDSTAVITTFYVLFFYIYFVVNLADTIHMCKIHSKIV
ncbi:xyloglucan:xyloglucosyl transferase [Trifolium repens]|nr:xyloglucan:xyloglucosyl transferase [Trifolium repens]